MDSASINAVIATLPSSGTAGANRAALSGSGTGNRTHESQGLQDSRAMEVARQFESLLVHNLFKTMRRTSFAEDKSNARSMYDDMLDEQYAKAISDSGGLGIAQRIAEQIEEQQGNDQHVAQQESNAPDNELFGQLQRSQTMAGLIDTDLTLSANKPATGTVTGIASLHSSGTSEFNAPSGNSLQLAKALWTSGRQHGESLSTQQQQFVRQLLPSAARGATELGTSPVALLSIAALETGWGRFMISDENGGNSHNLFGIKAGSGNDAYTTARTTEYINGDRQSVTARFKVFRDDSDAVDGFVQFLTDNPRYQNALANASDPIRFFQELQSAGYATDPDYAKKLISIKQQIEQHPLPL